MRLLQLNVTANWGSTGKIAEGIGCAAIHRSWDSYLAYGRMMNPSVSNLIKVGNDFDVYVHYAKNRFFDKEGLGSRKATRDFINLVKEVKPDVIQLHNIHDHWLNYPILFSYLAEISTPVVWTFHDCWAFTGGCYHFESVGCEKWRKNSCEGGCPQGHRMANENYQLKFKNINRLGQRLHIVGVSKWLIDFAKNSFLSETGVSFHVINNGIDTSGVFTLTKNVKDRMILGVSNIWPDYKGLSDFTELRNLLSEDIDIVLVGLSDRQIQMLPAGIKGIKRTESADELAKLYQRASVFVNPTKNDSFPTVNLEALACGTPVVTYRTGGSPEAVDDLTGIVVDKGDIKGLYESVINVLNNPDRFSPQNCRQRAVENFNKETQFNKYIDLYESILS